MSILASRLGMRVAGAALAMAMASAPPAGAQQYYPIQCDQWIGSRAAGQSGETEAYVIGALTGMILAHLKPFWIVNGNEVSKDQVYLWLDNFCRQNPLRDVGIGLVSLFGERNGLGPYPGINR